MFFWIILLFLIGLAAGFLVAAAVWAVRRGGRGRKHSFSRHSMPKLDIDDNILSRGGTDHAVDDFKNGDQCRDATPTTRH